MKLKEEYQKLSETMPSMTMQEKIEREWQEMYRSIDRTLPVAVLDKEELESRLGRIRADLVQAQKSLEETARS